MSSVEPVILHYKKEIEKITARPEKALKYEDRVCSLNLTSIFFIATSSPKISNIV